MKIIFALTSNLMASIVLYPVYFIGLKMLTGLASSPMVFISWLFFTSLIILSPVQFWVSNLAQYFCDELNVFSSLVSAFCFGCICSTIALFVLPNFWIVVGVFVYGFICNMAFNLLIRYYSEKIR